MEPKGLKGAVNSAKKILDKKDQLHKLYEQASRKAKSESGRMDNGFFADLRSLKELFAAWMKGAYRFSRKSILYIVAALIYFVNPFDLIPDFIIGLGFADDAAVLAFVLRTIRSEVERYKKAMEFQEVEVVS